jgi:outer membrane protein assembly factor BamB
MSGAQEWTVDLGDIVAATPSIGDFDGDGSLEIVYALVVDGGHAVLRGDGSLVWQNPVHDFSYRGSALVDVDGDGLVDVIDGDSNDPSVTAYRGTDGAVLWDVPLAAAWASGPIVAADTDGDGAMEVLVGSDAGLQALDAATGVTEWFLPLPPIRGEPLVKDIDGDGEAEILVGAGDGQLYVLGTPPSVAATLRVEPRTLNLRSNGQSVNAHLEFAEPVAGMVDPSTLRLEGVPADRVQVHGNTTIHAKFSREALIQVLSQGESVEVCATGALTDGRTFRACDVIRVILPGK